jgi:hypothetical protein
LKLDHQQPSLTIRLSLSGQTEANRFEQAIVDSSQKNGRMGIVQLPGVKRIIEEVRLRPPGNERTMVSPTSDKPTLSFFRVVNYRNPAGRYVPQQLPNMQHLH